MNNKTKGCTFLLNTLSSIYQLKMKSVFRDIYLGQSKDEGNFKALKAIVKYWMTSRIRTFFEQWKEGAQLKEVERYNNEEGPVAIENHILKKMIYNLQNQCIEDGISKPTVEEVIINDNKKSIQQIEKSVCRLFCQNDDLYLLPWCLDQWKKWVQHRKLFKYWLNYLNRRVDLRISDLSYAFDKWKYIDLQRKKELQKIKKEDLHKLCVKNAQTMNDLSQNLEQCDEGINDLTAQRDHLLQRYIGSQRLALAVTNASCDRAKQKTLSIWLDSTYEAKSQLYEEALKRNLATIAALKDKIRSLEHSNEDLADQNEELRSGAMDGIEMAKSVDDLTREREKLSIDLADKAISIRKLLEDNSNLSIRLSNAQEEAQNLIRISQMKLSQTGGGMSSSNAGGFDREQYY